MTHLIETLSQTALPLRTRRFPAGPDITAIAGLWYRRYSTRRQLSRLDDCALADIGINDTQRNGEFSKWFWQG